MKKQFLVAATCLLCVSMSCNNADTSKKDETSQTAQNQPATPADIKDDVSQKDVVQVALGSKDHTTLVAALKQADLVAVLRKSGPYTVFAPTNAAFDKLPKGTL